MVSVGVSMHPSNWYYMEFLEEEEAPLYETASQVPQYFGNTFDVPDTLRPDGLADTIIETVRLACVDNLQDTFYDIP